MSEEAFSQHILPMKDKLFRFAYHFLKDVQEAEDAVQDVMAGVWARRSEWAQWKSIPAYCMTATRNNCLDRLRRRKPVVVREGDAGQVSSPDRDPYEKMTNKEMMQKIQQCIDALPLQQRQVIHLREIEGFSYNEIAEVLDLTLDQVKVSLFRGRNAIRTTIIKEEEAWKKQR